jgi:hypothetical protein
MMAIPLPCTRHCWHPATQEEVCCWCNERKRQHGPYRPAMEWIEDQMRRMLGGTMSLPPKPDGYRGPG